MTTEKRNPNCRCTTCKCTAKTQPTDKKRPKDTRMFISINRLKIKPDAGPTVERRFAESSGLEDMPGFIRFQLLERTWNPHGDADADHIEYLALTEWRTEGDFREWIASPAFAAAHAKPKLDIFAGPGEPAGYAVTVLRQSQKAKG